MSNFRKLKVEVWRAAVFITASFKNSGNEQLQLCQVNKYEDVWELIIAPLRHPVWHHVLLAYQLYSFAPNAWYPIYVFFKPWLKTTERGFVSTRERLKTLLTFLSNVFIMQLLIKKSPNTSSCQLCTSQTCSTVRTKVLYELIKKINPPTKKLQSHTSKYYV